MPKVKGVTYNVISQEEREKYLIMYKNIQRLIKEQGFAPVQFAKKAGIDPKELQVWIHSHSVPRIDRLVFFCKALNVKPEQLLEGLL